MNILLVYPDIPRRIESEEHFFSHSFPVLGLNYLATILRKDGHNALVRDPLFNFLSGGSHALLDPAAEIAGVIRENRPDVVGISVLTPSRADSLRIARLSKEIDPKILVVAGGAHSTVMYEQLLSNYAEIDIVVLGEAEATFRDLVRTLEAAGDLGNVKGIAFRQKNGNGHEIVLTCPREPISDLDNLPFPDYRHYLEISPCGKLPTASIMTARGCGYRMCRFCASQTLWPYLRSRSPRNVGDEVESLVRECGVREIHIHDDTFSFLPERALEVFKDIAKRRLKVILDFKTAPHKITPDLLFWFRKAGGRSVLYGLESGSEKLRRMMGKPRVSNERVKLVVEATKKAGIKAGVFVMLGYPGETMVDIRKTCQILERLRPDTVRCTVTKAYPGTPLYEYAKKKRLVSDTYWLNEGPGHRYFTFMNGNELATLEQYDLLFKNRFSRPDLWAEYTAQDIPYHVEKQSEVLAGLEKDMLRLVLD